MAPKSIIAVDKDLNVLYDTSKYSATQKQRRRSSLLTSFVWSMVNEGVLETVDRPLIIVKNKEKNRKTDYWKHPT